MKIKEIDVALQKSMRAKWLVQLFEWSKPIYKRYCKRDTLAWKVTKKELSQMPIDTIGRKVGDFLNRKGFELESKLEAHDVCHILLDYDTDVVSEICLQYFLMASGKKSIYALGTCLLGLAIIPEYADLYISSFFRGTKARDFSRWDFEHLLHEKPETLRKLIFSIQTENKLYI